MGIRTVGVLAALSVASIACAQADETHVFDVYLRNQTEASALENAPITLMSCEMERLRPTRVGVEKSNMLSFVSLGLRYRYLGVFHPEPHGPAEGLVDGFDYRNEYGNYDTLIAEWDALATLHPTIVQKTQIGSSILNAPIYAYRVFKQVRAERPKPPKSVIILGTTHAREWISPSVVLHLGKRLTEHLASQDDTLSERLIDKVGVFFVPVINPDGYKHTWTTYRLWRKNRRQNAGGSFGVDINRNYSTAWGQTQGASTNPTSETYKGTAPFSEPENQAVRSLALSVKQLIGFIDYHSYGEKMLWPWSYTTSPTPSQSSFNTLWSGVRTAMVGAGGNSYTIGQGSTTLYIASGSSKDWFYEQFAAKSATIELRNTTTFELPTSQITPTQDESLVGFREYLMRITAP